MQEESEENYETIVPTLEEYKNMLQAMRAMHSQTEEQLKTMRDLERYINQEDKRILKETLSRVAALEDCLKQVLEQAENYCMCEDGNSCGPCSIAFHAGVRKSLRNN